MSCETPGKKRGHGKTVLIADDNTVIREMVAAAFLSDGFKRCGEAQNGKQAIEVAQEIKPDVIILDLSMPVMNGFEEASELRKILPNTPIILFTLHEESVSKPDASELGVNLVLAKGVSLRALIDKAHQLMGN